MMDEDEIIQAAIEHYMSEEDMPNTAIEGGEVKPNPSVASRYGVVTLRWARPIGSEAPAADFERRYRYVERDDGCDFTDVLDWPPPAGFLKEPAA